MMRTSLTQNARTQFTTGQWPPSYDPSLTLCSRRFYTFQHSPPTSTSTTTAMSPTNPTPDSPLSEATTQVPTPITTTHPPAWPCSTCRLQQQHPPQTHLIEITNYPRLASRSARAQVLAQCAYDAILLVYAVTDRASFAAVRSLHAEIPSYKPKRRNEGGLLRRASSGLVKVFATGDADGSRGVAETRGRGSGGGSGGPVVAIAGNKCDVDGEKRRGAREEGEGEGEKVTDLDYAIALFGLPFLRDTQHDSPSCASPSPASSSRAPQTRPHQPAALAHSNDSSETLNEWSRAGRRHKAKEATAVSTTKARTSAHSPRREERQVSHMDGESLALEVEAQVPFFETSAATGENVEELFEAIAKAVVGRMGGEGERPEVRTMGCRHGGLVMEMGGELAEGKEEKGGVVVPGTSVVHTSTPALLWGSIQHNKMVDKLGVTGQTSTKENESALESCQQKPGMLGRIKVFWKESTGAA